MFPNFLYSIYHVIPISLALVWLAMDAGQQDESAEVEENHPGQNIDGIDYCDGDGEKKTERGEGKREQTTRYLREKKS